MSWIPQNVCSILTYTQPVKKNEVPEAAGIQKGHENPACHPVCHPEFISGSQTMPGKEILKRVQNDRKVALTGRRHFWIKKALTIAEILRWAEGYLAQRKVPSPYLDAEYILAHILRCQRKDLLIYPDRVINEHEFEHFNACIERRGRREPLQY